MRRSPWSWLFGRHTLAHIAMRLAAMRLAASDDAMRSACAEELMNGQSPHVPLRPLHWDSVAAATAIDEIIADALAHFGGERFWPAHPMDDDVKDGNSSIYMGAAGMIW